MRKMIPLLAAAAVIAVMIWQNATPETVYMPDPVVKLPEFEGMSFEDLEMSEAERETLPKDTVVLRRCYSDSDGHFYQVSVVVGGRSKSSVHRPELCLPGQGFQMSDPHTLTAGGTSWRKLILTKGAHDRVGFAYTFVNGTGFRTSSHLVRIFTDVWDRSIHGRIDRWVMITVSTSRFDDADMKRFLARLEGVVE